MSEQSLAPFIRDLSRNERAHLCFCLVTAAELGRMDDKFKQLHLGILPMVSVDDAILSLSFIDALPIFSGGRRNAFRLQLRDKLKQLAGKERATTEKFAIALDDGKVVKRFGANLRRGIPLKGHTKRVTAGLKWSLPKKSYVPDDDATVVHHFTLVKLANGLWEVAVNYRFKQDVERYLVDCCQ